MRGQRLETKIHAESQLRAITLAKTMYPGATGIAADEILEPPRRP
jgi:hypothetical protein